MYLIGLILYYLINYCNSFIIPTELVSALGIIYPNIPPTKVGIDSRFGIGFRLGPHADYQTLIEIGPQLNTNSLSTNGTVAKRQSINGNGLRRLYNAVFRNSIRERKAPRKNSENERKPQERSSSSVGKIEFEKVAGIDDLSEVKRKNSNISKSVKVVRDSPTKFVLF